MYRTFSSTSPFAYPSSLALPRSTTFTRILHALYPKILLSKRRERLREIMSMSGALVIVGREGEFGGGPRKSKKGGEEATEGGAVAKTNGGADEAPKAKAGEAGPAVVTIKGRRSQVGVG